MIVERFWPCCDRRQVTWGATLIDSFWVEATHEEAVQSVFPMLSAELQSESDQLAAKCEDLARGFTFEMIIRSRASWRNA